MEPDGSARKRRPMAQSGKARQTGPGFRKGSIRATGYGFTFQAALAFNKHGFAISRRHSPEVCSDSRSLNWFNNLVLRATHVR
jgi:hypothetical protein